jgi:hypothetical protein
MAIYVCELCSNQPANTLRLSKITSWVIWFKRERFRGVLCSECAETKYFEYQTHSMRLGWWGFPTVLVNIVAVINNQRAIKAHRRLLPYVPMGNDRKPRKLLKLRKDPRAIAATAAAVAISATALFFAGQSAVTSLLPGDEPTFVSSGLGKCVAKLEGNTPILDRFVDCKYKHDWQVFGVTKSKQNDFNDKVVFKEGDDYCKSQEGLIHWDAFGALSDSAHIFVGSPDEVSWYSGARDIVCLVGDYGFQITTNVVTNPKASSTNKGTHERL